MFKTVLKSELKNIFRDKMYIFFCFYPVIMGVLGYYLVNYINDNFPMSPWGSILAMFFIILTGYIFGALTGFTLLDDQDDGVLMSLKITPISVKHYVIVKLALSYIFGIIATIAVIYATQFLSGSPFWIILMITLVGAIQGPGIALIVNSFADNKVEGFVIMKLSGLILSFPVIAYFVTGWVQHLLGIAPGYWAAAIIELELVPTEEGSALIIFIVGILYNTLTLWGLMKLYTKRANI